MNTTQLFSVDAEPTPSYSRGIVLSILLHIAVVGFFALKGIVLEDEAIDYKQAIRVDIVGLPEKMKPESLAPPPTPAEPAVKPELPEKAEVKPKAEPVTEAPAEVAKVKPAPLPAKPDKEAINLTKKKEKAALQKLKSLSAIEKIQQEVDKEKKAKAAKPSPIKGNIISPGTELTGLDRLQNDKYESDLDRHIKQKWSLPQFLMKKGYVAQAIIHVDENGQVITRDILKTSGNPRFDEQVLNTIDEANPLPAPPQKLTAKVRVDGIVIEFEE